MTTLAMVPFNIVAYMAVAGVSRVNVLHKITVGSVVSEACLVVEQDPEGNRQCQPGLAPSDGAQTKRQEGQATVHWMPHVLCSSEHEYMTLLLQGCREQ